MTKRDDARSGAARRARPAAPPPEAPGARTATSAFAPPESDVDGPTPLALYLAAGAGFLGTAVFAGVRFGAPGVVLVLVGAALVSVIASFWSSLRALIGETRLSGADAFAMGAPRAEEEQKRAVLRALKDLEFERSVGKISEDDYRALVGQYRAEAKRLLRQIDAGSLDQRTRVAELVDEHLAAAGVPLPASGAAAGAAEPTQSEETGAAPAPKGGAPEAEERDADDDASDAPAAGASDADADGDASDADTSAQDADAADTAAGDDPEAAGEEAEGEATDKARKAAAARKDDKDDAEEDADRA